MNAQILGVLSFIGAVLWGALLFIVLAFSGVVGDGPPSNDSFSYEIMIAYSGSFYLFLVFISCLPFMRKEGFIAVGIIAHFFLVVFTVDMLVSCGWVGAIILIPFICFIRGWRALHKEKFQK